MNSTEINVAQAGSRLIIRAIPFSDVSVWTALASNPKQNSSHPLIEPPIVHPNFCDMEDEENISPVARRPVFHSE